MQIPFMTRWKEPMLTGHKTMTCRTRSYGAPGDMFQAFGETFLLLDVRPIPLHEVAERYYNEEGCLSPHEFESVWNEIHPHKGFAAAQRVWLHVFKLLPKET